MRKTRAVTDLKEMRDQVVDLDIGGTRFKTTLCSLRKVPHTLFDVIFSREWEEIEKQADGSVFLDRDGTHFAHILNFLRHPDEEILLPKDAFVKQLILREARFYKVDALVDFLDKKGKELEFRWWGGKVSMAYNFMYSMSDNGATMTKTSEDGTITIFSAQDPIKEDTTYKVKVNHMAGGDM